MEQLQERFAVEVPLAELFVRGTPLAPLDKIESAAVEAFQRGDWPTAIEMRPP